MMYDELVERLRAKRYTLEELSIILPRAADAIEELQGRAKVLEKVASNCGAKMDVERRT